MTVNTINVTPTQPNRVSTPTKVSSKSAPLPAVKPTLTKSESSKPTPKPSASKPAPANTNNEVKKQQSILKQIETNLTAISTATTPSTSKKQIEVPIFSEPQLSDISSEILPEDLTTNEKIILLLQETLQLPEFGEVKVFLSIDRSGRLQSLEVLKAESAKNAEFLKNRLPDLQFPCLNEATSLTVVFSNAL